MDDIFEEIVKHFTVQRKPEPEPAEANCTQCGKRLPTSKLSKIIADHIVVFRLCCECKKSMFGLYDCKWYNKGESP